MRKVVGLVMAMIVLILMSKIWGQECPQSEEFPAELSDLELEGYVSEVGPVLGVFLDGSFILIWKNRGIIAQRFNKNGRKIGESILVIGEEPWGAPRNQNPAIAISPNGDFVITWYNHQGSLEGRILAQRFDRNCQPVGNEFQVNTAVPTWQSKPAIIMFSEGDFIIIWEGTLRDNTGSKVFFQRFNKNGNKLGPESRVSNVDSSQSYPAIARFPSGDFLITWSDSLSTSDSILAQRFYRNGSKRGEKLLVSNKWGSNTAISILSDESFIIFWKPFAGIVAQRFDKSANKLGEVFGVYPIRTQNYAITNLITIGDFLFIGEGNRQDYGWKVYLQRFDRNFRPLGETLWFGTPLDRNEGNPTIAAFPSGDFVVAWEREINFPIPKRIFFKIFKCSHCWNGIRDGDEIEIDCGGSCPPCETCFDGIHDGDETGIDCGGRCSPCPCDDQVKNGDEIGVDCGGPDCGPCAQLEVYDHQKDRWQKSQDPAVLFNPALNTTVIVPGTNLSDGIELPDWTLKMAQAISQRHEGKMNILAWNWLAEAKRGQMEPIPIMPAVKTRDQAQQLTVVLAELFQNVRYGLDQSIHLIGHNLGAHVIAWSGSVLVQPEIGRYRLSQVTLLDPPSAEWFHPSSPVIPDIGLAIKFIRQYSKEFIGIDTYTELYNGPFNFGLHNVHLWVDIPNKLAGQPYFGRDVYEWYQKTIWSGTRPLEPTVLDPKMYVVLPGTIGYTTINPAKRLNPICDSHCRFDTLVIQHTGWQSCCFKQEKDCGNCESVVPETTAEYLIDGETITGDGEAIIDGSSFRFWLENPEHKKQKESELSLTCAFPVEIGNWDYVSFDYEFLDGSQPATLMFAIRANDTTYPALLVRPSSLFSKGSSALLPLNVFAGQTVEFVFELTSDYPRVEVQIQSLTLSQDARRKNQPPIADAGPDAVHESKSGMAEVTLSAVGSSDPEGGHLWCRWLFGESYWDDGPEIIFGLPAGIFTFTLQVTDEFGAVATDEVQITVTPLPNSFLRGDANRDNDINIADPIRVLNYLFADEEVTCLDAADPNDSGAIDIADAIYLLSFLFGDKIPPLPPFPEPGFDLISDELGCEH